MVSSGQSLKQSFIWHIVREYCWLEYNGDEDEEQFVSRRIFVQKISIEVFNKVTGQLVEQLNDKLEGGNSIFKEFTK